MSVKLNIKCSNEAKTVVDIASDQTVLTLKQRIEQALPDYPATQQRLIYSGRVLKDEELLSTYKLVVKGAPKVVNTPTDNTTRGSTTTTTTTSSSTTTSTHPPTGTAPNPFTAFGAAGFPPMGGMGAMGGMVDPARITTMLSNPATQQMMAQMMQNPQIMDMLVNSNPMLANMMTPELRQSVQGMMSNPQMMQNMMQMASMMPGGAGGMGGMGGAGGMGNTTGATGSTRTVGDTALSTTGAGGMPTSGVNPLLNPMMLDPAMMQQMMGIFGNPAAGGGTATPQNTIPPEERYATQLQQLVEMGFFEPERNLRALQLNGGNVHAAIEWLFSNP